MEDIGWFKIQVIYLISGSLDENEELSEVEKIQLMNDGQDVDFEIGYAFFNPSKDFIDHIHPKAFVPKGKTNKKYITELVMNSGRVYYANMKPEQVYDLLNEYVKEYGPKTEDQPTP